ncbi:amidase [Saccharopolyspora taberi]|uniref:Asp-tRNA(Asn)/Glu-tRNA(Gln) amidotransferase GatCAB subunit A n=1 Tax=Saccharopolyspora taberi TaxID=60895 RepID=A0ABN3UZX9_9PSEU
MLNSIADAGRALRAGEVTSVGLLDAATAAADRADGVLGVYLTRFREPALEAARRADRELAEGLDRGPLHGIPVGVKDLIAAAEGPTTAQSLVLGDGWGAGVDAAVVARVRDAGGVITGKTTTMEFGCGLPDPSKPFPVPRNPWNTGRWAGGSSSGTASGVATGMFLAGLGSDTAGSIRMPAAFCGVTGLLPTFGRVPRSGCVPLAYSLDRIGPLARTARDCGVLLEVISGHDPADPDSARARFENPAADADLTGLRVGVVREGHFPPDADPALATAFDDAVAVLEELGAETTEVRLPYREEMVAAVVISACCEGMAHHRAELVERWSDFTVAARGLLAAGALVSGADYVQAQRARRVAQAALSELFGRVDVIVCPTASVGAPWFEELVNEFGHQDNEKLFSKLYTPYWNSVANPVLAVPIGSTDDGRPLSMQLAGKLFDDASVLRVGDAFQQRTGWHLRTPDLTAEVA